MVHVSNFASKVNLRVDYVNLSKKHWSEILCKSYPSIGGIIEGGGPLGGGGKPGGGTVIGNPIEKQIEIITRTDRQQQNN